MKTKIISAAMFTMMSVAALAQNPTTATETPAPAAQPKVTFDVVTGQVLVGYAKTERLYDFAGKSSPTNAKQVGEQSNSLFVSFGGPSLKFGIKKVAVNVGMYPSLRVKLDAQEGTSATNGDKTCLTPILGTGFTVTYKHLAVGCLFYNINKLWYAAPAIGYKFK